MGFSLRKQSPAPASCGRVAHFAVIRRLRGGLLLAALAVLAGCVAAPPAVPVAVQADAEYLLRLGLMRGHLLVGNALLALGHAGAAQTHAKHPSDELYSDVAAEFATRGVDGFAAELEAHAAAVAGADAAAAKATYAALDQAIARCEGAVSASPSLAARVIARLLNEAAREYAVGVVDGQLRNAHEYQDAYGFTQVAQQLARARHAALDANDPDRAIFAAIARRIAALGELWPTLMPPPDVDADAAPIAAAATDVAEQALKLRVPGRFGE